MKKLLGVIGGSGFDEFAELAQSEKFSVDTPFGECRDLSKGLVKNNDVVFIPRHGHDHSIAPQDINYRANIWALKQVGVSHLLAINAVGGINDNLGPGVLAIPDQIIDYTYGRDHTYYSGRSNFGISIQPSSDNHNLNFFLQSDLDHIDFTIPYDESWREFVLSASREFFQKVSSSSLPSKQQGLLEKGVYGCTQGPRLETAAEIKRLKRDGCDMVGMTGMPEAALARELSLPYACIAVSVNWAAGLSDEKITFESIKNQLEINMVDVKKIIEDLSAKMLNYHD